jgi:uncharacterized membrane protein
VITLIGFLASNFATRWIFSAIEDLLEHTPLVKLVYTSIKDLVGAFVGEKKKFDRPCSRHLIEGSDVSTVGFLTRDGLANRPSGHVAVYVPQAYNIGGNVIMVPKNRVRRLQADPSAVMTFVVSGGVTGEIAPASILRRLAPRRHLDDPRRKGRHRLDGTESCAERQPEPLTKKLLAIYLYLFSGDWRFTGNSLHSMF